MGVVSPADHPSRWPLRACLLSGGASRRMGRDKALLPHQDGGSWLAHSLQLLAGCEAPLTLLSRHRSHLEQALALAPRLEVPLTALMEPPPHEGQLRALARLMAAYPDERLLLCPVDMPWLDGTTLAALLAAAATGDPTTLHLAHDGERLQPLLGLYPSTASRRRRLHSHLAEGNLALHSWLDQEPWQPVPLQAAALRNANRPSDLLPNLNS
jgi:molybdopterin-guanine dinucleotide biosynthesis protein A